MSDPLVPLPKLPRKVKEGGKATQPKTEKTKQDKPAQALVALPSMSRAVKAKKGGWGAVEVGRWFEPRKKGIEAGGVCCRCGRAVRAIDLGWAIGAFNAWEGWTCRDCRQDKRLRAGKTGRKFKRPEQKIREPLPFNVNRERYLSWEVERSKYEADWENEGGAAAIEPPPQRKRRKR